MQEPSGIVLTAKLAVELVRRKALLAGSGHRERNGPLSKLGMTALHHGAGHDGEVLATSLRCAAVHASLFRRVVLIRIALGADRAIRPTCSLEPFAGGGFVVETGGGKNIFGHGYPLWPNTTSGGLWCQLRKAHLATGTEINEITAGYVSDLARAKEWAKTSGNSYEEVKLDQEDFWMVD